MLVPLVSGLTDPGMVRALANRRSALDPVYAAWASYTGVEAWQHLLVGDSVTDHGIAGADFSAAGGVAVGVSAAGLNNTPIGTKAFGFTDGSSNAVLADLIATGQPSALDTLDVAVVRVPAHPGGTRDIFGNRDATSPNYGREIQMTTAGTLIGQYDTSGGTTFIAHAGDHGANAWFVVSLLDRQTDATPDVWIGTTITGATNEGATNGLATSAANKWSLGKNRGLSFGGQILVWGQSVGAFTSWGASEINALTTSVKGALVT